jgi:hypothetical protein
MFSDVSKWHFLACGWLGMLHPMPSSLKNETNCSPSSIKSSTSLSIVFEASFHSPFHLDKMKLGGHFLSASGLDAKV